MPDFEGLNLSKEKLHTTDLLRGKVSLMSFVYAKYGEVYYFGVPTLCNAHMCDLAASQDLH